MTFDLILLFASLALVVILLRTSKRQQPSLSKNQAHASNSAPESQNRGSRFEPKPPWVREEVIRLKALMADQGCRKIASTFNLLHESKKGTTVGKSFVANVVKNSASEIEEKRRHLKNQVPRPLPRNIIWALDLTTVDDRPVLGVIDHGTRACLELSRIPDKTMMTILRSVIDLIEKYGRPKALRTDNEGMFASSFFWLVLKMLGVRHQQTLPQAPWQNGRIERLFGTLKAALLFRSEGPIGQYELKEFRCWYNHARPHQHLGGRTPAEAWDRSLSRTSRPPRFLSMWNGKLTGFAR